jgi:hypothetical protein
LEAETMTIIERVKNICLTPKTEWPVIAGEPTSSGALITGYVAPLAAVGAAAGFVGLSLIGQGTFFFGTFRLPIVLGGLLAGHGECSPFFRKTSLYY